MSFGRRDSQQSSGQVPRRMNNRNSNGPTLPPQSSPLDWGKLVTAIAAMVIVVSVGFISYALVGQGLFNSKPSPKTLAIFADEPEPIARVYKKTGKPLKRYPVGIGVRIDYRLTGDDIDPIDSELHEKCMKPATGSGARRVVEEGFTKLSTKEAAKFIACSMTHQRSRFCKIPYRDRLARRIITYLRSHHSETSYLKNYSSSARSKQVNSFSSSRSNRPYMQRTQGPLMPNNLASALSRLSELGLINSRDFIRNTGKVHEALLPFLKDEPSPC